MERSGGASSGHVVCDMWSVPTNSLSQIVAAKDLPSVDFWQSNPKEKHLSAFCPVPTIVSLTFCIPSAFCHVGINLRRLKVVAHFIIHLSSHRLKMMIGHQLAPVVTTEARNDVGFTAPVRHPDASLISPQPRECLDHRCIQADCKWKFFEQGSNRYVIMKRLQAWQVRRTRPE